MSYRPRAQALIEAAAFLPIILVLVGILFYAWLGMSRQVAFATTANTLAEWIARSGGFTASMSSTIQSDLSTNFGIDPGDAALYIRVTDATGTSKCSIGVAPDGKASGTSRDGIMPTTLGWSARIGTDGATLTNGLPSGYQVSVTIWGYSSLPGLALAGNSLFAEGHAVGYAEDNGFIASVTVPTCT